MYNKSEFDFLKISERSKKFEDKKYNTKDYDGTEGYKEEDE